MSKLCMFIMLFTMLFAFGCGNYDPSPSYDYANHHGRRVVVDPDNKRKALPPQHRHEHKQHHEQRPEHEQHHNQRHEHKQHHEQRPAHDSREDIIVY